MSINCYQVCTLQGHDKYHRLLCRYTLSTSVIEPVLDFPQHFSNRSQNLNFIKEQYLHKVSPKRKITPHFEKIERKMERDRNFNTT